MMNVENITNEEKLETLEMLKKHSVDQLEWMSTPTAKMNYCGIQRAKMFNDDVIYLTKEIGKIKALIG